MQIPLKPKRTDFSFKSFLDDPKFIREHAAENPFGILPDPPQKQLQYCNASKECTYVYDPNMKSGRGICKGFCAVD